jgi:endo-1,4-beta-xylanase
MPSLSRRGFVLGAAGATLVAPAAARATRVTGLRQIAESRGLMFGSMIRGSDLGKNRALADTAGRECDLFVCRVMHWDYVEPRRGTYDYAQPDSDAAWAAAHAMKFRGHALLWGEHAPKWFAAIDDRNEAARAITDHAARVPRHFAGRMQSWDVVNEAIKPDDGRPDGLRRTAFLERVGPDYLDIAFHAARGADPKAKLVYNDFDVEFDLPWHRQKRRALFNLLDGLRRRDVPIDMVGLQGHIELEKMPHFEPKVFEGVLRDLSDRGFEVMITELDVTDRGAPSDIAKRDAEVASAYRRYLDVALASRAVKAVITWGLSDADSWITNGEYPQTIRADGLKPRPLPFDAGYAPKPAYVAIAEALHAAPAR